jgi:hypothetical protein
MDIRDQDFFNFINAESGKFKAEALQSLYDNLAARGYEVTGKLKDSIRIDIEPRQGNALHAITLQFLEKGKGLDSKKNIVARASLDQLVDWIKERGLERFEFVPGYTDKIPSIDIAARRLAFVFLKSSATTRENYKPWLYREYFGIWADHRERIVSQFVSQTSDSALDFFRNTYSQVKGKSITIK